MRVGKGPTLFSEGWKLTETYSLKLHFIYKLKRVKRFEGELKLKVKLRFEYSLRLKGLNSGLNLTHSWLELNSFILSHGLILIYSY